MAEKDIAEKLLEDYNDVFADIVNVLLFDGQERVNPESLTNTKDKSQYKADDSVLHEQERDVSKFWSEGKIRIALYELENQTDVDNDMPFRVIGYDGAAYKSETLDEELKERYPVVTLVLYFGEKRWKRFSLYDCLGDIPEYLKPYVSDYKINVFEIAYLTDEQVKKFKSDFKFVADYFVQMRKNKNYIAPREVVKHVDEVLKLMQALTKDTQWGDSIEVERKGVAHMDHYFSDRIAEARETGKLKGRIEMCLELGLSVSEIAEKNGMSEDEVSSIIEELEAEKLQKKN